MTKSILNYCFLIFCVLFSLTYGFSVVQQFYQSRVIDEFVLKGNTGILKCLVPSFVTDFVQIESWVTDDGTIYKYNEDGSNFGNCNCIR